MGSLPFQVGPWRLVVPAFVYFGERGLVIGDGSRAWLETATKEEAKKALSTQIVVLLCLSGGVEQLPPGPVLYQNALACLG